MWHISFLENRMKLSKDSNKRIKVFFNLLFSCASVFLLTAPKVSVAEDIELYLSETVQQIERRPKVLIIFDTSGSMTTEDDVFREPYDPNGVYGRAGTQEYVYYTTGDATSSTLPDPGTTNSRFLEAINGCQVSRDSLASVGYFTGRIKYYRNTKKQWTNLPSDGSKIEVLDCKEDVLANNPNNGKHKNGSVLPLGYPVDEQGSKKTPIYYTNLAADADTGNWSKMFTLYSDHYLRWFHNSNVPKPRTRMEVAKESVTNLINSSPGIDFGLQIFNRNGSGGRIVHGIQETTDTAKVKLLTVIDTLYASGNTPLCESLYETYQYFAGKTVWYGNDYLNSYDDYNPVRDNTIESGSNYIRPFTACDETIYVVMISDGEPTSDNQADTLIKNIPVSGQDQIVTSDRFLIKNDQYNYLPALAGWMYNNDIHTTMAGQQSAEVYTIGFGADITSAAPVLAETAKRGGGQYFPATDSASLTAALTTVLANIAPSNDSLTSASVAANNFDRTETLDSVYYAMFQPARGPRWQGNLKKYKVTNGIQKGANGIAAINSSTGGFSNKVQSYWSSGVDGDLVAKGGVAEVLRKNTNRVIYSDLGPSNALVALTYAKASASNTYPTQSELATALDVTDDIDEITNTLHWINGKDVDDEDDDNNTAENRADVFGDPLHSKPVVINYGNGDIYIVVGTNHGVLHMFKDDDVANTVEEKWAFMPKEFLPNITVLRENLSSAEKVYGIDGIITSHIVDGNGNGIVDGDDKVWLFFGYRRGGSSYYAMDVTNPSIPSVMWTIEGGVAGSPFEELGQTWSQPKITYSALNIDNNSAKPVLIFGGGYDPVKDSHAIGGKVAADTQGKAIYMVDAQTGALKWSLSPTGDTVFNGTDSIPSSIATLDSDGDGLTDRLYVGDSGGNIWRIDMPGNDKNKFSVFKLAEFGGDTSNAVDRRFFNEPAIVRAYITETINSGKKDANGKAIIVQQDIPYDALLIGSGDRTNPIGTDTDDTFFMVKDINIKTLQFTASSVPAMPTTPIKIADLADYTNNPFGDVLSTQAKETLSLAVSLKSGWFIDMEQLGEKATSAALVINNVVYFTTYTPPSLTETLKTCDMPNGQGWLYAVDLSLGIKKYNWQSEDAKNRDDRIAFISEQFLGAPTLIVTKKLDPDTNVEEPDGNIIVGRKIIPVGFKLQTLRTYLYVTEE